MRAIDFITVAGLVVSQNCQSPATLWDTHSCEITANKAKFQSKCAPIKVIPTNQQVKGLIVMYHGYTACPDSMQPVADLLSSKGFAVVVPLLPGHGISVGFNCQGLLELVYLIGNFDK